MTSGDEWRGELEHVVSDPELITAVRAGDRAAFGELYRRHVGPASTLARQFARTPAEADDLVSEAFARVLDQLLTGHGPDTAFRAYLFTSLRNTAYDRTRKDRRLQFTDDMTGHDRAVAGDDPVVARMESGLVAAAFARLPERWQAVLWHTQVEGESPAAVGALLGMAPGAVSSLAFRAREGLREAYLQAHLADTAGETCRTTVERLGAWTRGGLSKREKAQVDAHLAGCDRCRTLAAELQEVNTGLRALLAPVLLGAAAAGYLATLGPVAPMAAAGLLGAAAPAGLGGAAWGGTGSGSVMSAGATSTTAGTAAGTAGATAGTAGATAGTTAAGTGTAAGTLGTAGTVTGTGTLGAAATAGAASGAATGAAGGAVGITAGAAHLVGATGVVATSTVAGVGAGAGVATAGVLGVSAGAGAAAAGAATVGGAVLGTAAVAGTAAAGAAVAGASLATTGLLAVGTAAAAAAVTGSVIALSGVTPAATVDTAAGSTISAAPTTPPPTFPDESTGTLQLVTPSDPAAVPGMVPTDVVPTDVVPTDVVPTGAAATTPAVTPDVAVPPAGSALPAVGPSDELSLGPAGDPLAEPAGGSGGTDLTDLYQLAEPTVPVAPLPVAPPVIPVVPPTTIAAPTPAPVVVPTEPVVPVVPTEAAPEPSSPTVPTEPSPVAPTEPSPVAPTEPVVPTEAAQEVPTQVVPTEPVVVPTEPTVPIMPTEPSPEVPTEPVVVPTEPTPEVHSPEVPTEPVVVPPEPMPATPTPEVPSPEVPTEPVVVPPEPTPATPMPEVPSPEVPTEPVVVPPEPIPATPSPEVPTEPVVVPTEPTPATPTPEVPSPEVPTATSPTPSTPAPSSPATSEPPATTVDTPVPPAPVLPVVQAPAAPPTVTVGTTATVDVDLVNPPTDGATAPASAAILAAPAGLGLQTIAVHAIGGDGGDAAAGTTTCADQLRCAVELPAVPANGRVSLAVTMTVAPDAPVATALSLTVGDRTTSLPIAVVAAPPLVVAPRATGAPITLTGPFGGTMVAGSADPVGTTLTVPAGATVFWAELTWTTADDRAERRDGDSGVDLVRGDSTTRVAGAVPAGAPIEGIGVYTADVTAALAAEAQATDRVAVIPAGDTPAAGFGWVLTVVWSTPDGPRTTVTTAGALAAQPTGTAPVTVLPAPSGSAPVLSGWAAVWRAADDTAVSVQPPGCAPVAVSSGPPTAVVAFGACPQPPADDDSPTPTADLTVGAATPADACRAWAGPALVIRRAG